MMLHSVTLKSPITRLLRREINIKQVLNQRSVASSRSSTLTKLFLRENNIAEHCAMMYNIIYIRESVEPLFITIYFNDVDRVLG